MKNLKLVFGVIEGITAIIGSSAALIFGNITVLLICLPIFAVILGILIYLNKREINPTVTQPVKTEEEKEDSILNENVEGINIIITYYKHGLKITLTYNKHDLRDGKWYLQARGTTAEMFGPFSNMIYYHLEVFLKQVGLKHLQTDVESAVIKMDFKRRNYLRNS